jgi:UDP-2,3-diacylglucosamine pyrophosphatase LpxH
MRIICDTHLNARRKAGTTPASQEALRRWVFQQFKELTRHTAELVILGDLFDSFEVDNRDLIETFTILDAFVGCCKGKKLTLIMGNHDWSMKADKVSSFDVLATMLQAVHGNVHVVRHGDLYDLGNGIFAIAHQPNQAQFDALIEKAYDLKDCLLLLHCNIMSPFAQHSDHSLNLSEEQVERFRKNNVKLVVGHEHTARDLPGVTIIGNQIPTSISDVLQCSTKRYVEVSKGEITSVPFMTVSDVFSRVGWQDLDGTPSTPFMRIEGKASAEEAAEMVDAIARYRQQSDAFVITNAVEVEGIAQFDDIAQMAVEKISGFSVLNALLEELEEEEVQRVKELLK